MINNEKAIPEKKKKSFQRKKKISPFFLWIFFFANYSEQTKRKKINQCAVVEHSLPKIIQQQQLRETKAFPFFFHTSPRNRNKKWKGAKWSEGD
jgi:hypothetical protein